MAARNRSVFCSCGCDEERHYWDPRFCPPSAVSPSGKQEHLTLPMTPAVPDPTVEALRQALVSSGVREYGIDPAALAAVLAPVVAAEVERAVEEALLAAASDSVPRFNVHPLNRSNTIADWLRERARIVREGGRP